MDSRLPLVAHPGAATVAAVRRESGHGADTRLKGYTVTRRESHRVSCATQHKVFAGYTDEPRDAESLLKPEIAWCEQNAEGLWSIIYGPFIRNMGYEVRFGFTNEADARDFAAHRKETRSRKESAMEGSGEI